MTQSSNIFGKKVVISKKSQEIGRYVNYKIQIGSDDPIFVSKDAARQGRWSFDTKSFFKGGSSPLDQDELEIILQFVKFLIVFQAYEYTLGTRRNFLLSVETTGVEKASDGYHDFDYRKEVKLESVNSNWGSRSAMSIYAQFDGHVTNEGGNQLLERYYSAPIPFINMTLQATEESMIRRLGEPIGQMEIFNPRPREKEYIENFGTAEVIDGNNPLATAWFVLKILPTYYMLANMR